jgi:glycerol transport system permease protein
MDKWEDNKSLVPGAAGVCHRRLQRHHPTDDRGQLLHPGYFRPGPGVFVGTEWFKEMLTDNHRLHDASGRQFLFSGLVLLIEIPLGILIALAMPKRGWGVSASLVTLALPLVIPWNVIGTIWIIFTRPDIGLFGVGHQQPGPAGMPFDHTARPSYAWITLMAMEVWHWTPLVALLAMPDCAPSRRPITRRPKLTGHRPGRFFAISNCPKCAVCSPSPYLLRWMDSFLIYAEPFALTGGGPGNTTTFLIDLPGQAGHRPIRPGAGGGLFADLFSHCLAVQLASSTRPC